MRFRDWFRPPHHVLMIFVSVVLACGLALAWLGWLLLKQDNELEAKRRRDRVEQAAGHAVIVMQRSLSSLQSQLDSWIALGVVPPAARKGVIFVSVGAKTLVARPASELLYYPSPAPQPEAPEGTFTAAERFEFTVRDLAAASQSYETLAASPDPAVRAGALAGLARVRRQVHDAIGAKQAYDRLSQISNTAVQGLPSGLIARDGRAGLFQEALQPLDLQREAAAFRDDLRAGRWQLNRQQYEFYSSAVSAWLGGAPVGDPEALALSAALDWLWRNRPAGGPSSGHLMEVDGSPVLVVSKQASGGLAAVLAGRQYFDVLYREAFPADAFHWSLADLEGRTVLGPPLPGRDVAVRTAAATLLPWALSVSAAAEAPGGTPSPRRRLLLWGFAVLVLILGNGTYFILRSISRELRVARLQSDFVGAVSHEFRSPLTSLLQISEMLAGDRFPSDEARRASYNVLVGETGRLRRLVEELLDFGRFEAGATVFHFEILEAGDFLRAIVGDFQERIAPRGYTVELHMPDDRCYIRADREALARALWNLLDNAVKYSPECHTVWVDVEREESRVAIAVRDRGFGIPVHEQHEIFNRFVRGADSKARRIQGTGIGLAMVRHIVRAHGGEIRLASRPGQGSRFTMVLRGAGGVS